MSTLASAFFTRKVQPEPKFPTALFVNASLKAAKLPHFEVIAAAITAKWGSYAAFKEAFVKSAVGNFGSGWTWLVKKPDGTVDIVNTGAAGTPLTTGDKALLTVDVWEHAYYIDYRNLRPKWVETFLTSLVNWDFAEANFA